MADDAGRNAAYEAISDNGEDHPPPPSIPSPRNKPNMRLLIPPRPDYFSYFSSSRSPPLSPSPTSTAPPPTPSESADNDGHDDGIQYGATEEGGDVSVDSADYELKKQKSVTFDILEEFEGVYPRARTPEPEPSNSGLYQPSPLPSPTPTLRNLTGDEAGASPSARTSRRLSRMVNPFHLPTVFHNHGRDGTPTSLPDRSVFTHIHLHHPDLHPHQHSPLHPHHHTTDDALYADPSLPSPKPLLKTRVPQLEGKVNFSWASHLPPPTFSRGNLTRGKGVVMPLTAQQLAKVRVQSGGGPIEGESMRGRSEQREFPDGQFNAGDRSISPSSQGDSEATALHAGSSSTLGKAFGSVSTVGRRRAPSPSPLKGVFLPPPPPPTSPLPPLPVSLPPLPSPLIPSHPSPMTGFGSPLLNSPHQPLLLSPFGDKDLPPPPLPPSPVPSYQPRVRSRTLPSNPSSSPSPNLTPGEYSGGSSILESDHDSGMRFPPRRRRTDEDYMVGNNINGEGFGIRNRLQRLSMICTDREAFASLLSLHTRSGGGRERDGRDVAGAQDLWQGRGWKFWKR